MVGVQRALGVAALLAAAAGGAQGYAFAPSHHSPQAAPPRTAQAAGLQQRAAAAARPVAGVVRGRHVPQMGLLRSAVVRAVHRVGSRAGTPLKTATEPSVEAPATAPVDLGGEVHFTETTMRSLVKAIVWRFTAAIITLISGLVFSGNLKTAASIVGTDFLTKSGTMFIGERVWNKVNWGKGGKSDGAKRSLAKALLWRVFAAGNTLICGIFLARDLSVAAKIAGSDTVVKTALFYVNERMWARVEWGKQYDIEFII